MNDINEAIDRIRDLPSNNENREDMIVYLDFYNIKYEHVEHQYEFVECRGEKIFMQTFSPSSPKGVIYVVHGYFDHAGSMSNLINHLTSRNYQVITYDLPGHGLSSGNRASINDFNHYVDIFKEIIERKKESTSLPTYAVSHSTGGAIMLGYLLSSESLFQKVVVVSPLIRSYAWNLSKIGFMFVQPFVNELRRIFKKNSSNSLYLKFVKEDPLQYNKIPLAWFKSLMAWNKNIKQYLKSEETLLVIQGDKDKTVDWKYNLDFIQEKFPHCKVRMVSGGNHQLFNEEQELLQKTLEYIDEDFR